MWLYLTKWWVVFSHFYHFMIANNNKAHTNLGRFCPPFLCASPGLKIEYWKDHSEIDNKNIYMHYQKKVHLCAYMFRVDFLSPPLSILIGPRPEWKRNMCHVACKFVLILNAYYSYRTIFSMMWHQPLLLLRCSRRLGDLKYRIQIIIETMLSILVSRRYP